MTTDDLPVGPDPADVPAIDDWAHLLAGRVAVVTGGGAGIGGAISRLFAQHGAVVEMAEIDDQAGRAAVADIEAAGGRARAHACDVRRADHVERFAAAVLDEHTTVQVLVNNVGDHRPMVPFHRSSPESWTAMYEVNLLHVFAVTRAFLPAMVEGGGGSIVNVHSVEGLRGFPPDPVYAAMKAAVAHFTTSLAVQQGRHGVRVNAIAPDLTQTPGVDYLAADDDGSGWPSWAPVGRLGWPADQARAALFLASDLAAFVTGQNLAVDGGTRSGGGWFRSPMARRYVNRPPGL